MLLPFLFSSNVGGVPAGGAGMNAPRISITDENNKCFNAPSSLAYSPMPFMANNSATTSAGTAAAPNTTQAQNGVAADSECNGQGAGCAASNGPHSPPGGSAVGRPATAMGLSGGGSCAGSPNSPPNNPLEHCMDASNNNNSSSSIASTGLHNNNNAPGATAAAAAAADPAKTSPPAARFQFIPVSPSVALDRVYRFVRENELLCEVRRAEDDSGECNALYGVAV